MKSAEIDALLAHFRADVAAADSPAALDDVRRAHTGKKSALKAAFQTLREVPADDRAAFAQALNVARETITTEWQQAQATIESRARDAQLAAEWQDLTMPGIAPKRGARHPLSVMHGRCMQVLRQLGFEAVEGNEVEHPWYNFDALNIPEHHPARDLQDTFWVDGGWLLRSHATTVQARILEQRPAPPVRVASMGRVYRNEAIDATHTAMFHQFEGIWLEQGLSFAHLKGTLRFLAESLFSDGKLRFKPKFYPYTEPSVGVDLACSSCDGAGEKDDAACVACHGAGWVTILGAGMIHPKVLHTFGYDPDDVTGIAFGLGTSRMAAQYAGVKKGATLYEQDLRVHHRLPRGAA